MKKYILLFVLLSFPLISAGQALNSGYFVDNYTLGHQLNPAFAPRKSYVGFPLLSNININFASSLGASNILYPLDNGKLGLFLHPDVPSSVVMNGLKPNNSLNANIAYDIFSIGWYTGEHFFWTIDAGVRAEEDSNIPKELFAFLKNGMSNNPTTYNIENFKINENIFSHISFGFSTDLDQFVKGLRVGAKVKFLLAMNSANIAIDNATITMSDQQWSISSKASGTIMGKGIDLVTDDDGKINNIKFNPSSLGVCGFGLGFDLGVQYRISQGTPVDGLTFSLSATDLGFLMYGKDNITNAYASGNTTFSGLKDVDVFDMSFSEEFDKIKKELLALASFYPEEATSSAVTPLTSKVRVGVEYPFLNDMMSVGVLYTGRFNKVAGNHELTFAYNYKPKEWFDLTLSYSVLNSLSSFGWLLNFTPNKGVNFFIGSDYTPLKYTPQGIPVKNCFLNIQTGISFPFGKR